MSAEDLFEAALAQAQREVDAAAAKVLSLEAHVEGARDAVDEAELRLAELRRAGPAAFAELAATAVPDGDAAGVGVSGAGVAHNPTVVTQDNVG